MFNPSMFKTLKLFKFLSSPKNNPSSMKRCQIRTMRSPFENTVFWPILNWENFKKNFLNKKTVLCWTSIGSPFLACVKTSSWRPPSSSYCIANWSRHFVFWSHHQRSPLNTEKIKFKHTKNGTIALSLPQRPQDFSKKLRFLK